MRSDKKIRIARAIYYAQQERLYKQCEKQIDAMNLREDFNVFKKHYKGKCANKVYYYFFKSIDQLNAYYKAR